MLRFSIHFPNSNHPPPSSRQPTITDGDICFGDGYMEAKGNLNGVPFDWYDTNNNLLVDTNDYVDGELVKRDPEQVNQSDKFSNIEENVNAAWSQVVNFSQNNFCSNSSKYYIDRQALQAILFNQDDSVGLYSALKTTSADRDSFDPATLLLTITAEPTTSQLTSIKTVGDSLVSEINSRGNSMAWRNKFVCFTPDRQTIRFY